MLPGNIVEYPQIALRLVPEVRDAVDMILPVCQEFGVVDAIVLEIRYIEHVVAPPEI